MNKNRSQEEIIANILLIVMKEPRKTHIMYKANLSYTLLSKYLDKLVEGGLIKYRENSKIYELTKKGETYLDNYAQYKSLKNQLEADKSALNKKEDILTKILNNP